MKKVVSFIAAAAMAVCLMAGCSAPPSSGAKASSGVSGATGGAMKPIAKDKLKIGVIHITDPAEGAGYTYTHDIGIQAMQKEIGLEDSQIVRKNNVPDTDPAKIEWSRETGCHHSARWCW